jgi:2-polyprenyl-6-methoxyphenol hydroxylase-like FAD-dependent oxidoreductase
MASDFDAVIVGAGPAGTAAAIALARAGWTVGLVEKQRFPRRKVCGECIAASNLPLLVALGIGDAVAALAGPELRRVALMCGDREVVADLPPAPSATLRWGRALGRETLDTLLLEQARALGVSVMAAGAVQAIAGAPADWRCAIRDLDSGAAIEWRARVVVAANGSWEALPAQRARVRERRSNADLLAFKANFVGAALSAGLLPVLALRGGYGGMVVADGGITTVACCIRRDRLEALRAEAPGASAGDVVGAWLMRECAGVRRALDGASRDGPWLAAGPLAPGIRLRADDAIYRIGNAAGEAHPILGEGISMALQSAGLLCAGLIRSGRSGGAEAQAAVGRRYAAQWRHHFAPRLALAAAFAQAAMRPTSAAVLIALARTWPGLLTQGAKWGGKVRCAADQQVFAPPPACQITLESTARRRS